mgnify:CR=1 FL=1
MTSEFIAWNGFEARPGGLRAPGGPVWTYYLPPPADRLARPAGCRTLGRLFSFP